jgi:amino acid efflux transporter
MTTLRRTIGLGQGVSLYVGAILGPGLLVLPGVAAEIAGPASLLSWLALAALSVPMALTFAALARRYPDAGGFAAYTERAFGPGLGALAGWLFYLSIPSGSAIVALIAGRYAANALGLGREGIFLVGAALVLVAYGLNVAGLRLSGRLQVVLSAALVLVLSVAIAGALPRIDPREFEPFAPHGATAIGVAAVALFWAFAGWEAITPLAEEFRDPSRDIPRATWLALLVVGAVYVALAAATIGTHAYGDSLGGAPLAAMVGQGFGAAAELVVSGLAVFISLGAINAYVAGASRLGYALGRDGHLPGWFGALHPRLGTPHHSLAFLAVGFLAWMGAAYALRLSEADLLPISTSSYIATYVLSMAAGVRLLGGPARLGAVVGTAGCLLVLPFVGTVLAWVLGVTIACVAYRRLRPAGVTGPTSKRGAPRATAGPAPG